jgi:hypothetical protein
MSAEWFGGSGLWTVPRSGKPVKCSAATLSVNSAEAQATVLFRAMNGF